MPQGASPNVDEASVRAAADKVLQDKAFRRSPVLSRLLGYLLERSLAGVTVKSYTIATEALGRAEDVGVDADTYARVAVARLRKALAAYYQAHPDEAELYVDAGSYAVLLREAPPAAPALAGISPADNRWQKVVTGTRRHLHQLVLLGLCVVLLVAAIRYYTGWRDQERWIQSDFPTLAVVIAGEGGPAADDELDSFGNILRATLDDYFGFRLVDQGARQPDYQVLLDMDLAEGAPIETVTLVDVASGRLVWIEHYPLGDEAEVSRGARRAAAAIAAPGGALNDFGRRKGLEANSPYGCWLRFTGSIMSFSSRSDEDLQQCAEDWYAADPASRMAAFVRNWTMVDASITTFNESSRQAQLEEALTVVHRALARYPDNGMLYIGEMRTYSFLGNAEEVRQAARSAVDVAPDSRVIAGMAGTWLTFWNDPQGPEILADLDAGPESNLPWEHAGHFVAAMMREDVAGAGHHLGFLRFYLEDQPALAIMEAAYFRRTGRSQDAQAALDRISSQPGAWLIGTDAILDRMPIGPEVRARLRQWMAYPPA